MCLSVKSVKPVVKNSFIIIVGLRAKPALGLLWLFVAKKTTPPVGLSDSRMVRSHVRTRSVCDLMQHEAAANPLYFEELHRVPLDSEQIVPQQGRPLGACCGIVAGSSCSFNATV